MPEIFHPVCGWWQKQELHHRKKISEHVQEQLAVNP